MCVFVIVCVCYIQSAKSGVGKGSVLFSLMTLEQTAIRYVRITYAFKGFLKVYNLCAQTNLGTILITYLNS